MLWSYVQGSGATGNHTTVPVVTIPGPTPAGNLLVAGVVGFSGQATAMNSVPAATWTRYRFPVTNNIEVEIWYTFAPTTGTYVVTPFGIDYGSMSVDEFVPPASASVDATAGAEGTGTTATSANLTVSQNDLIYSVSGMGNGEGTKTAGSGYTKTFAADSVSSVNIGIVAEYKLNTTSSPDVPSFTFASSPSGGWSIAAQSFQAPVPTSITYLPRACNLGTGFDLATPATFL